MAERPVSEVPWVVVALLLSSLALHVEIKSRQPVSPPRAEHLAPAPSSTTLRLVAFGDPVAFAKGLMLYLQAFDYQAGSKLPYRNLDYGRLIGWLGAILELDPGGQYALHAASRLYAEVPDEARQRLMLEFVYKAFFADPDRRWPWLAHAASVAKHRLNDLPLARRYAAAIQQRATGANVPLWAKQMEAFILEDMNELETARIMIGGFIQSSQVTHPGELRFLEERLKQIERRLDSQPPKN